MATPNSLGRIGSQKGTGHMLRSCFPRRIRRLAPSVIAFLTILAGAASLAAEPKVFFGLMHGHTSYSDGDGEPAEAFEMAKDAGLDFLAITEHNHHQAAGDDGVFLTPYL